MNTPTNVRNTLRQATSSLAEVSNAPLDRLSDEDLLKEVVDAEALGRHADTLRTSLAGEVAERSRPELGTGGLSSRQGQVRPTHLLEQMTLVSSAEAARRVSLGKAIRSTTSLSGEPIPTIFPEVVAALRSGTIGVAVAAGIIKCLQSDTHGVDPALRSVAEHELVAAAAEISTDLVMERARAWREALDPDGAEPRDEEQRRRRSLSLGREQNGMSFLSGWIPPISAALIKSIFSAASAPGSTPAFLDEADRERGTTTTVAVDGTTIITLADPRTRGQRNHDALFGVLSAGMRTPNAPMTPLTKVLAVVQMADLQNGAGVAWFDDIDEPVSAVTTNQLICESGYTPVLMGEGGDILKLGRTRRLFTPKQRMVLAVRDGGCVWPNCSAPPGWCEAHHVTEWEKGGLTDVDNGALLCSAHHHSLHATAFTMRMIAGRPHLQAPPWMDPDQIHHQVGGHRVNQIPQRR